VETDWIGKRADLPLEQEVEAGNDLMMPGYPAQVQDIVDAVKNGKLDFRILYCPLSFPERVRC
jgi:beta-glucosidase